MTVLGAGTVIDDKYELVRLLGEGGMGSVWQCRHRQLGAPFAIKFLHPELTSSRSRARFELEAKSAAGLRTRHVVRIYDHGVDEHAYIVMELLEGEDLGARMSRFGRLPLAAVSAIAVQIAKGLYHAHQAGIVHRDLKPANIFLARCDGEEEVKIVDFGLAKLLGPLRVGEQTKPGQLLGTVPYMSPEHAQGQWERVDARADLWSLAVILYRAVTGKLPFEAPGPAEVIARICSGTAPAPSSLDANLPGALDPFFARALARAPEDRFASAPELAAAFVAAVGQAEPSSWSASADISGDEEVTHALEPAVLAAAQDETLDPTALSLAQPAAQSSPAAPTGDDPTTLPLLDEPPPAMLRPAPLRPALAMVLVVAVVALGVALSLLRDDGEVVRVGRGLTTAMPTALPSMALATPSAATPSEPVPDGSSTAQGSPATSVKPPARATRPPPRPPPPPRTDFGY